MDRFTFKTDANLAEDGRASKSAIADQDAGAAGGLDHGDPAWSGDVDAAIDSGQPITDLTYDQVEDIVRMMAPTPGIEGTDIGSGG